MKTFEKTVEEPSVVTFHDTVEDLWKGDDEAVRARVVDWAAHPAERLRSQLETLADFYNERSDRQTLQWRGATHEFTEFATRNDACTDLEELYLIHDTYSMASKHYRQREYAIDMFFEDAHHRIQVSDDDELSVYKYESDGRQEILDEVEREAIVADFFLRSLVAAVRNQERSPQERDVANADALSKLHLRRYGGRKTVAATE